MKRFVAVLAIAAIAILGVSAQSLTDFQTTFKTFAEDMAGSLSMNSTVGANWSDAYIGSFPHLGVGVTGGAAFVNVDSAESLFTAMGATMPSELTKVGIPIPAAVATLKIGIPFLPIDVGVKGGYLPPSVSKSLLSAYGASAEYTNVGIQVRYALVKQNLLLPNVSIGAAYNYQKGSVTAPTGVGAQSMTYGSYSVSMTNPNLDLGWVSNTVDFTAQVSKKLLFLVPYAGAGLTLGKSTVTGGLDSSITTDYPGGLTALQAAMGADAPDFSATGFSYTADSTSPIFRVYGGISFRIIILDLDVQAMYVPADKSLGASLTARVQF